MTVRDLIRTRLWAAALAGGAAVGAASAQSPAPPAATVPVLPPTPAATPAAPVVPVAPPPPVAAPVVPPAPAAPVEASVVPAVPVAAPVPAAPPAGAALPPLVIPASAVVPSEPAKREVAPAPKPTAVAVTPPVPPAAPVAPPTPPVVAVAPPTPPAVPVEVVTPPPAPAKAPEPAKPAVIKEVARPIPPEPVAPAPKEPGKLAGAALTRPLGAVSTEPPATARPKVTGPSTTTRPARFQDESVAPAADPAAAFEGALLDARTAFARVRDYSCHFLRQERVRGRLLPEQTAEFYARTTPHSVALRVIAPAGSAGVEAVYVAGKNAGKVRVKPAGGYGPMAWVSLDPADPRVTSEARHSAAALGIGAVIDRLERIVAVERRLRNPLGVVAGDYEFAGRPVVRYEVVAERPHALRYAHRVVVYVDKELKLPVRFEAYDQPTAGNPAGELLECHSFVNVKLNAGVGDAAFDK